MTTEFETPDFQFAILGAGYAGIGTAIALAQAGIQDFVMVDKDVDFGGTWHVNTYPGIAVDLPGVLYTFHDEQYPEWRKTFPLGHEIKEYVDHCVAKYGLRDHAILGVEILSAEYDEANHLWRAHLDTGHSVTCRYVIGGWGLLQKPKMADVPGLESFSGTVMHTARWNHDYDYKGKRVAVIGTGASAVQVVPAVAPDVARLHVYQRTPSWIMPRPDPPVPELVRKFFRRFPGSLKGLALLIHGAAELVKTAGLVYYTRAPFIVRVIEWMCLLNMRIGVRDKELRTRLRPRSGWGCTFPTVSNKYYPTFNRDNVELVTDGIERIDADGIWTVDGVHRPVDMIVMATGFRGFEDQPPLPLLGRAGEDLRELFQRERIRAFHGASVPVAPNAFLPIGPYSFTGHSYALSVDFSARHLIRCVAEAQRRGATEIQVTEEANERYFQYCLSHMKYTAFYNNNCNAKEGYFFDPHGDVPLIRPSSTVKAWFDNNTFDVANDYRFAALGGADALPPVSAKRRPRWIHLYQLLFRHADRRSVAAAVVNDDLVTSLIGAGAVRRASESILAATDDRARGAALEPLLSGLRQARAGADLDAELAELELSKDFPHEH
ncbi:NAD(P)/FAD-dependent oxidoreductase [Antrihabitans sp. YC2-6]|uniref:flavin-containing monooxygenase n=1 Tax=Antrihabitans sp. YC2-6 TaxID=2799498 RepID=UPI0018F7A40F|nr:NAD(P)/FAD-dependent oxidoreductase [Antrihabitans sp. YC2-6]MBJ8343814.1 NAD(P)/FAD-dependent oxidoreductase [Antrihabitans sp. YC2-6]